MAFGDLGAECKSIFTIHNLNYGADLIGRAMAVAAAGTTVSPTYAAEVGCGLRQAFMWKACNCTVFLERTILQPLILLITFSLQLLSIPWAVPLRSLFSKTFPAHVPLLCLNLARNEPSCLLCVRQATHLQVSGHPAVAPHMTKFYGIRNGIDQDIWDPLEDRFLPRSARLLPTTTLYYSSWREHCSVAI